MAPVGLLHLQPAVVVGHLTVAVFGKDYKLFWIGIEKHKQNMCICTSLFVSFSVALDKKQTFPNNNVFHKLSRPTPPLQVVYKP